MCLVRPRLTLVTAVLGLFMLAGLATADTINVRVTREDDDLEERLTATGFPIGHTFGSSDLELGGETQGCCITGGNPQAVGMRFLRIGIPRGSTIDSATIQFTADETNSVDTSLLIYGQLSPDPATFSPTSFNITSRPKTTSSMEWNNIPPWEVLGEAGPNQRTPDFSAVVQEIIDQPGWADYNSMVVIITITPDNYGGQRTAEAYSSSHILAPQLSIDFTPIRANFDSDLDVDGDDLIIWQNNFGLTNPRGTPIHEFGDADNDSDIDGRDFVIWQTEFSSGLTTPASSATIPEPSTWLMLMLGMAALIKHGRSQKW